MSEFLQNAAEVFEQCKTEQDWEELYDQLASYCFEIRNVNAGLEHAVAMKNGFGFVDELWEQAIANSMAETLKEINDDAEKFKEAYGYKKPGMAIISEGTAWQLYEKYEVFALHKDNTETRIGSIEQFKSHDGLFGIRRSDLKKCAKADMDAIYPKYAKSHLEEKE